jgi:arabinose-5-phosphate isomerase
MNLLDTCRDALREEAKNIENVAGNLDANFLKALEYLTSCTGKIVLVGVGKSGIIARKIASTFSSIGKPSFFLHADEASHGDLGMVSQQDVVICISKSGSTKEILDLLPSFKRLGLVIISITNNEESKLARGSDIVLLTHVEKEACPVNLAPTTSTTVTLAIGDALAVGLAHNIKLTPDKFAINHPSGDLGKRIILKVEDVMSKGEDIPVMKENQSLKESLMEMTRKRLGFVSIINAEGLLRGILTDGDLRRLLGTQSKIDLDDTVSDYMTRNPKTCKSGDNAYETLKRLNSMKINCVPVVEESGKVTGAVHIQQLLSIFEG